MAKKYLLNSQMGVFNSWTNFPQRTLSRDKYTYIYIDTYKHTVSRAIGAISDTPVGDEACVQTWSNDSTKNINIAQLSITR